MMLVTNVVIAFPLTTVLIITVFTTSKIINLLKLKYLGSKFYDLLEN